MADNTFSDFFSTLSSAPNLRRTVGSMAARLEYENAERRKRGLPPLVVPPGQMYRIAENEEMRQGFMASPSQYLGYDPESARQAAMDATIRARTLSGQSLDRSSTPRELAQEREDLALGAALRTAPAALPPPGRKPEYEGSGQNRVSDVVPGGPGRNVDIDALMGGQFTNAVKPPNLELSKEQEGARDEFITDLRKQLADKYEGARKGISDITLEKPTFEEGFGKIDPGMALALAGLSMFQPGKSAAEAISSGAKTGLMQLSEDRKLAAAQQREMREAQRQFVSDSLAQAKTLADIDLRSTEAELKVQELAQRHEEAIRLGNYRNASLELDRMRAIIAENSSPGGMVNQMAALDQAIAKEDDPNKKAQLINKFNLMRQIYGRTGGLESLRVEEQARKNVEAAYKRDGLSLDSANYKRDVMREVARLMRQAGLSRDDSDEPTTLPPTQ